MPLTQASIEILLDDDPRSNDDLRVVIGVPLERGSVSDAAGFALTDSVGNPVPAGY